MQRGTALKYGDFSIVSVLHHRGISTQFSEIPVLFFFLNETEIFLMLERCILGCYILFALTWMYPTLLCIHLLKDIQICSSF